jgi:hypothetical protein
MPASVRRPSRAGMRSVKEAEEAGGRAPPERRRVEAHHLHSPSHGPHRGREHCCRTGLDFGAGALAVVIAPYVGDWVYAVAGVIVVGSLPVLGLNIARVARREWKRHSSAAAAAPTSDEV